MSAARCNTCGHLKQWSGPSHFPDCPKARAMRRHPAALDPCPAHPGEDLYDCRPCEALSDERREA